MKISMIIFTDFTFDVRVNKEASALIEYGYNCEVIAYTGNEKKTTDFEYVKLFKMREKNKINKMIKFTRQIIKYYRKNKPDIIHIHDLAALPIGFIVSRLFSIPIIFDAHELYHEIHNFKFIKRIMLRFFIPKLYGLITVNDSILSIYEHEFGAKNGIVINNSPDFNIMSKIHGDPKIFEMETIDDSTFILLFQGYIVPDRGLERLINIMISLPNNFKLIFLGSGDDNYILSLKLLAENLSVKDKVYFKDAVPYKDLLRYTSSASMGIYLIENTNKNQYLCLPNKIFEFLTAELPVLSVDFPEIKKVLVSDSKAGIVVPPDMKNNEIAKKIISFANSEDYQLARAYLKNNKAKFIWNSEKKKLIQYYKEIAKEIVRS